MLVCKQDSAEISHTIKLKPHAWNTHNEEFITTNTFAFSNLNASIQIYPNGDQATDENHLAVFVRLFPQGEDENELTPKDTRKVKTTIRYGSHSTSFTAIASRYGKTKTHIGWGYPRLTTVEYAKKHPTLHITLQMSCIETKESKSFEEQHVKLYELSKLNGDVTLIVMNEDNNNDEDIQSEPPHKKRKCSLTVLPHSK
eukprot:513902_1